MGKINGGLGVTKPISNWNRAVEADFKKLFVSLSKAVVAACTGQWASVVGEVVGAVEAVKLEKMPPEELAYLLIWRAVVRSLDEIVYESSIHFRSDEMHKVTEAVEKVKFTFENIELRIDETLFYKPSDLPLIAHIKTALAQWFVACGMEKTRAGYAVERYGTYFTSALDAEWRERDTEYERIQKAVTSPFTATATLEREWLSYSYFLTKQFHEPVFGYETFGVSKIYVELRAYHERKEETGKMERELSADPGVEKKKIAAMLEHKLEEWLKKGDKNDALRVIAGGPGSGKSTFTKMWAAKLSNWNKMKILHIPLFMLDLKGELIESIGKFATRPGHFKRNPIETDNLTTPVLIIFDGLDELPVRGQAAVENARSFMAEINNQLLIYNNKDMRLMALVTGRTLSVQAAESVLRRPGQVLHLLPYMISDNERKGYTDTGGILKEDQRNAWWSKYGKAVGKPYKEMPEVLRRIGSRFDDITTQPLLNYLVAMSFERGKVEFTENTNLNMIYEDLLTGVYERAYDKKGPTVESLTKEEFVRVLKEIAVCAWHSGSRAASVGVIRGYCEKANCGPLLKKVQDDAKSGVIRLLTGFYFSQVGNTSDGDEIFEFTHKSFQEYLAAMRIVGQLKANRRDLEQVVGMEYSSTDETAILERWARLCGPAAIDRDMFQFIQDQLLLESKEDAAAWQKMLCNLIERVLHYGMPMEKVKECATFEKMMAQSRNAEEALLAALYACALRTEETSEINWPEPESAGEWIRRLQGQRKGSENKIVLDCIGYLSLRESILHISDMYRANLRSAKLISTGLVFTNLYHANLSNADLCRADLSGANLGDTDLRHADLSHANLSHANLSYANLGGAYLSDTNLNDADMLGANMHGADLHGADLCDAKLLVADLSGADLRGAKNLSPEQLMAAKDWEHAYRDAELACGKPIPKKA